jgi:hypothetical protein
MQVNKRKIIPVVKITEAVFAQTCMDVSFILSVSDTIFAMIFLLTAADHSFRSTVHKLFN